MMTDSQKLLADYAKNDSEAAFRELATRYIDLVYSTALRLVDGDAHRAQDTVQTVFIDLARLAPRLSPDTMLGGWLHRDTCFVAAKAMRGERRRQLRERQAAEMNALNQSDTGLAHLAPVLDEAINQLGEEDRKAILLRFYERRDLRAVGEALGSSENAAQKRVSRALEQLRNILARQGVALSAAALATGLAAETATAAPAGLAASIATTALASAATAGGIATTLLKTMALTKLKIGVIGAIVVAGVTTPLLIQHQSLVRLREENQSLLSQVTELTQAAAEAERFSNLMVQAESSLAGSKDQTRELLRLRGEVALLRGSPARSEQITDPPFPGAEQFANNGPSPEEAGRKLGMAVVRGDADALARLSELAKAEAASFNTNSAGLNDTQRGDLVRQTFAPLRAAFQVIGEAAIGGNQVAVKGVVAAMQFPELRDSTIPYLGIIASRGNDAALEVLLNPQNYGFLKSSAVGALQPAADSGNQKAIDALAAVVKDANQTALWYMAARGLEKSAESGNAVAIDALITLSASTNVNVRSAIVPGLRAAALNQNAKAAEALSSMGIK